MNLCVQFTYYPKYYFIFSGFIKWAIFYLDFLFSQTNNTPLKRQHQISAFDKSFVIREMWIADVWGFIYKLRYEVIFYLHYKFILFYGFGILWILCIIAVKYNAESYSFNFLHLKLIYWYFLVKNIPSLRNFFFVRNDFY